MMKYFYKLGYNAWIGCEFIQDRFWRFFIKKCMGHCGKNVKFFPKTSIIKGVKNIYLSDDVRFGRYAMIYTSDAKFLVESKVAIAPYFKVITGNHTSHIGHFFFDNDMPINANDNKDVHIENDCWIGTNVTLLSGVNIGRGCIVASGALLTKSFPPYSVIGGVPAKIIKQRFTIDEILEHESKLYPEEKRFSRKDLEELFK